ncbi:MAG TPA: ABC transporter ATP-binding protein [Candidatus Polarisedimenticolia bacterium]|nr:ABC transporter ATP-binding protein [Candidatus Polarisedimenticolia bacterium]
MTPAIELVGASKKYGNFEALKNVSFAIEKGSLVAMLGPNGAGKTTSINLMLGLRRPTSGKALIFGDDPRRIATRKRFGAMLQESGVPQLLKVTELVELFRSYYSKPLPTDQVVKLVGLDDKANTLVRDLSGGQTQRLYFALAICGDPEILFLDEPTVGMDVEGRRVFLRVIRDFAAGGKTILLTTHYLEEADELAERVLVIDKGKVIADGSPQEIKSRVAGSKITFTSSTSLDAAALSGLPVSASDVSDHRVTLMTNDPQSVLRELFRRNVDMANLEVRGADLEEAFISLTGGG